MPSTLGYFARSGDAIRAEVIKGLPERVHEQFPGSGSTLSEYGLARSSSHCRFANPIEAL